VTSLEHAKKDSSYRSFVKVKWHAFRTRTYRRGHEGSVDIKCVTVAEATEGEKYYRDHLPKLGNYEHLQVILQQNNCCRTQYHTLESSRMGTCDAVKTYQFKTPLSTTSANS